MPAQAPVTVVGISPEVPRLTTSELAAEELRRRIFDGRLRPGDRIPIDGVAADLGVSRLPVREAVQLLARDGLITARSHHGAYVAEFDADVLRDHFHIVGMVQGMAAARLARGATVEQLADIRALNERLQVETTGMAVHRLVMAFMARVNEFGGSARQRSVLRALGRMLPSGFFIDVPGSDESSRTGTRALLDAIESGDPVRAEKVAIDVVTERAELVIAQLQSLGVFAE